MESMTAARDAWTGGPADTSPESRAERYAVLWQLYRGEAFLPGWQQRRRGVFRDQRVYAGTRQIYSHVAAVVDFYAAHVYQGTLTTDGRRLPDGTRGAIPLDPQTGDEATDAALLAAVAAWWARTNWQEGMTLRPRYGAALGDVLTELVDDLARHAVWPRLVWPGHVVDLALDHVGNVKAYALEYLTTIGERGQEVTFRYRKEVDGAAFRYYRDDRPWADADRHGDAVQPNPYGFVPAIWDRHINIGEPWGLSAIAGMRRPLVELNSVLSHAMDFQQKAFRAPILVRGSMSGGTLNPARGADGTIDPKKLAEQLGFWPIEKDGGIDQLSFDIGQTLAMLEFVKAGILEANPEASFYHDLREMSTLTGPAVERALGDAVSRVNQARAGYDAQSVKLFQMALAMAGYRLNRGDWENPTARDRVFEPFDLDSYTRGELDMVILGRPVVPMTQEEVQRMALEREQIRYADTWVELGRSSDDAEAIVKAREEAELRRMDIV